jgi:predicted dehydrogenase
VGNTWCRGIAKAFANAFATSQTGKLVAVGSRCLNKARQFAQQFNARHAYGSYESLLHDEIVQAIYVATPHSMHAEWAIKACQLKKHVLIEKPFALNYHQATAVIEAAIANNVIVMEGFMYRCHPQTAALIDIIRSGVIGEVRIIEADFSFNARFDPNSRLFSHDLAGGGILDLGCYPISMSRLIAGAARGEDFVDPVETRGVARLGRTDVDEWAVAVLRFPGDILAQVVTGISVKTENVVRIFGSEGKILVPNPWVADRIKPERGRIILQLDGEPESQERQIHATKTSFAYEADVFGDAIMTNNRDALMPAMSWQDTLGNAQTLDEWRKQIGLSYASEIARARG